jgi:rod shape-determining protein MreD
VESKDTNIGRTIITAIAAVLLQVVLAPNIAINAVVPNFMLVAVVISATRNNPLRSTILGFILGLIFDLATQGPMGCMTLILTLLGYFVSVMSKGTFTGGLLVDMVILLLAALLGELLNSVVYAVVGMEPQFLLSLAVKVLPATVYDGICGLIVLLIYHFFSGSRPDSRNIPQGRSLHRKLN